MGLQTLLELINDTELTRTFEQLEPLPRYAISGSEMQCDVCGDFHDINSAPFDCGTGVGDE